MRAGPPVLTGDAHTVPQTALLQPKSQAKGRRHLWTQAPGPPQPPAPRSTPRPRLPASRWLRTAGAGSTGLQPWSVFSIMSRWDSQGGHFECGRCLRSGGKMAACRGGSGPRQPGHRPLAPSPHSAPCSGLGGFLPGICEPPPAPRLQAGPEPSLPLPLPSPHIWFVPEQTPPSATPSALLTDLLTVPTPGRQLPGRRDLGLRGSVPRAPRAPRPGGSGGAQLMPFG